MRPESAAIFAQADADGRRSDDQVYQLFVDFDVELSDAFFDPLTVGRIY